MYTSKKPIIQIAYAVKDVEKAASFWSKKFNIGPFYINEHIQISNTLVNINNMNTPILNHHKKINKSQGGGF